VSALVEQSYEAPPREVEPPTIAIGWEDASVDELAEQVVSYQAAQFHHLAAHADVVAWGHDYHVHARALAAAPGPNAMVTFDECNLFVNPTIRDVAWGPETSFVWLAHDSWHRPLSLVELLRQQPNPLLVLRHLSAIALFDRLAPELPKVLQRPGVEPTIFHPRGPKQYDVLLSGSETPDYPHRIRFNAIVRANAERCGWKLLDLSAIGLLNNWPPRENQLGYAPALAAAKVSPTATVHGGRVGATLVTQYLDHSPARADSDLPFYALDTPELLVEHVGTGGVTPRYLESFASKTLLIGDLPAYDAQEWYRDKMIVIEDSMSDDEIVEIIDYWVHADNEREALCEYAYAETLRTETSAIRAAELSRIIARHLAR
jgi:hypothetical protein